MQKELPIACALSEQELRLRQESAVADLTRSAQEIIVSGDGYLLRFQPEDGLLQRLAGFVEHERQCCQFLQFTLTVEPASGPVSLAIQGPEGAGEFLLKTLRLSETGAGGNEFGGGEVSGEERR
jgi:hypothetical protein